MSTLLSPGRAGLLPDELAHTAAARAIAALPQAPVVCDMYSPLGAELYHDFTARDTSELAEITRLARASRGTILELAAGSGRITFALLGLGRPIVAVDLSPSMLEILRSRLATLPSRLRGLVTPRLGDMTELVLDEPVHTVVLGTTSISLLTPAQRALALDRVRDNLTPGGRLILTTVRLTDEAAGEREKTYEFTGATGRAYRAFDIVMPDRASRWTVVLTEGTDGDLVCHSCINILPPGGLVEEIESAGLELEQTIELPGDRYQSVVLVARRPA